MAEATQSLLSFGPRSEEFLDRILSEESIPPTRSMSRKQLSKFTLYQLATWIYGGFHCCMCGVSVSYMERGLEYHHINEMLLKPSGYCHAIRREERVKNIKAVAQEMFYRTIHVCKQHHEQFHHQGHRSVQVPVQPGTKQEKSYPTVVLL